MHFRRLVIELFAFPYPSRLHFCFLGYGSFTECITEIATSVLEMLKQKTTSKHPVRILSEEDQKTFDDLLDIGSGDVRYIGIHGVGGIGKTTLAKSVFKQFSSQFEGCSFLADVGELWKRKSKECLDQLLRDIPDVSEQRTKITERFRGQKVLIVLDNVDTYEQIKNLAGKPFLFGPGSRIIITARDRSVLTIRDKRREILTFEMKEMHPMHALQLFSRHAFGKDSPPDNYCAISSEITNQCRRNPLVLEILGSFLHRKSIDEWEEPRKKLQEMSRTELRGKLMISYEKLNFEAKQIFLDIACFFINKETTKPRYMWESCYFFQKGLESLIYMSFVKIIDNDKLWMHDEVRDLGREMANLREKDDHGREWIFPSRLWEPMKAREIMEKPEVKWESILV